MCIGFVFECFVGNCFECVWMEFEIDVFYFEQFGVLFGESVFWFGQDLYECSFVEFIKSCDYW